MIVDDIVELIDRREIICRIEGVRARAMGRGELPRAGDRILVHAEQVYELRDTT